MLEPTGRIHASDLDGLAKSMPWTARFCLVGAASISAFPLFSGFVSKSMIMAAALAEHHDWVWFILLFAAAGVFHHAGIKIPFFAFYAHDAKIKATDPPKNQLFAMGIAATLCIVIGTFPQQTLYTRRWCIDTPLYSRHGGHLRRGQIQRSESHRPSNANGTGA